jgi:hypothetical protein
MKMSTKLAGSILPLTTEHFDHSRWFYLAIVPGCIWSTFMFQKNHQRRRGNIDNRSLR